MADAVDAVRCGRMKRQQFDRVVHANFEEKSIQLHQVRFANVKQHKQNYLRHPERKEFFCDLAINKEFDPPTGTRIEAQFSRIKAVMMTRTTTRPDFSSIWIELPMAIHFFLFHANRGQHRRHEMRAQRQANG